MFLLVASDFQGTKREGQWRLDEQLKNMTSKEKLAFWDRKYQEMIEEEAEPRKEKSKCDSRPASIAAKSTYPTPLT
ncbi:MAG: hypothetical protein HYV26_20245 [Candidatus Hydrogenedentes bacterium]|nr:hypothetical protein [Candidatus Hydrogenedentota bacterium]